MTQAQVSIAVSELHGGICGLLCAGGGSVVPTWVEECLGGGDPVEGALDTARNQLRELELHSWRSLMGSGLDFYPLIPEDDASLEERVGALALWCHGFLFGLSLAGFSLDGDEEEEDDPGAVQLGEIVNDLSEISRADLSADEFDDEDEADFALAELIEYVRVSVQIMFEELESTQTTSLGSETIH
mgnify:CR=1 FL=1